MTAVTLNQDQRLFVLRSSGGFSCLGFDVVFKRLKQYAEMLGLTSPNVAEVGTMSQYKQYLEAERAYIATNPKDTLFDPDTPLKVRALLEAYLKTGAPVRIFLGDAKTGRDWLEEHDVYGTIGRSMGPIKVALLVERGQSGGGAISTASIVRIVDGASHQEMYRHPGYQAPTFQLKEGALTAYPVEVEVNGKLHARFKTEKKAHDWIAFMQGTRMKA